MTEQTELQRWEDDGNPRACCAAAAELAAVKARAAELIEYHTRRCSQPTDATVVDALRKAVGA